MNNYILNKLKRIQKIIYIFGDVKYQEDVWINGHASKVSSYEENRAQIYDDVDLDEFLVEESETLKTIGLLNTLTSWSDVFSKFDQNITIDENGFVSPDNLMENKEWKKVRDVSRSCAEEIKFITNKYDTAGSA
jgi:hypothetical protein